MRVLRVCHSAVVSAWRARERELVALGHQVTVVTAQGWNEGGAYVAAVPRADEDVVPVRTVGRHPALFLYDPLPLWRAMSDEWDVIDIHEEPFALATAEILLIRALRRRKTPYVLYSAQNLEKRYPIPFRWLERWAIRHAAGIHTCNYKAGEILQRKGFPGKPRYIPLGVDLEDFSRENHQRKRGDNIIHVGYVGRLASHKGVSVLLKAIARRPQLELTIAGGGPEENALRDEAQRLGVAGRVAWLGTVEQHSLPAVYAGMDVLAVPSRTTSSWVEQFGRVALEAMASGIPVVASDTGALPDVVGNGGVLVPENEPDALADALVHVGLDTDLRATLSRQGIARAQACAWPVVAAEFDDLYRTATQYQHDSASTIEPEIIVVAYGTPSLLAKTLASVQGLPVTVVDNSSQDEVRAVCETAGVRYLDPGFNGGFGSGVNHALARRLTAQTDVLLLNPDAQITHAGVRTLHRTLRASADLASVGALQVDDGGNPARVTWPWPTPWRSCMDAVGLGRFNRSKDYAIGSVLMLRSEALAQVGGFDEEFFLYAEETDWTRRAALMGWRHGVDTGVTAVHIGAATSTDSVRRDTHFYAGQERYFRKHFGRLGWQTARTAQLGGALVRMLLLPGSRGTEAAARARLLWRGPVHVEAQLPILDRRTPDEMVRLAP